METLFTYFIKVSVLVSLFYLSYHFLLKRETFFSKNRLFLLLGLVTSVTLPIVTITKIVWVEPVVFDKPFILSDFPVMITEEQKTEINWSYIVAGFYLLGMLFFLVKFILSSLSLYKILHKSPIQKQNGFKFIDNKNVKTPFSFFNYIAFDSSSFSEEELQNIITHEKIHSKQKHSFDIILSEIFSVVFWLNPFVWLYKKAIQQNLEFLADNKAVKISENKVNYQKTLLKITINPKELALANPFFQPLIKKRIIMLNKNQSKNRNLWKYTFILPILAVFVMQFQTKVVAQEKTTVISQEKEQQYKLPTSVDWEYAKDALITADTIVWVKDFAKSYDEWTNQSTGEKVVVKGGSWKDVQEHLNPKKKPLYIINGKEIPKEQTDGTWNFEGAVNITEYNKKEAVVKFGEIVPSENQKTKVIIKKAGTDSTESVREIEIPNPKTPSIDELEKEIFHNPKIDYKKALIIINDDEVSVKGLENTKLSSIRSFNSSVGTPSIVMNFGEKAKNGIIIIETYDYNIKINRKKTPYEERQKMIEVRKKELEERRNMKIDEYETFSIIGKDSSDSDIEFIKSKMQENGIQMKVSTLKRNKNGEIYKITISLTENLGTENNKRKAKSEATFERENESIPNIFVGKQNGNLIVSSNIK